MTTRSPQTTPILPTVPRLWPGETVVCLGCGPSLTAEDVDYCRGKARVIAINDAWRLAPWADVLYASDARWWAEYQGVPGFTGRKYCLEKGASKWPGVEVLRNTGDDGLERDPTGLRNGRNSGYASINLAVHLGAARVLLLGYDLDVPPKGASHFFGDHPPRLNRFSPYQVFRAKFETIRAPLIEAGVEVINCSRWTALRTFPRRALREVVI